MGVCASVDLGSSVTKGVAEHGNVDVSANFPSVVVPAEPYQEHALCIEDRWWLVGTDAMLSQRKQDTRPQQGAGYHGSVAQRALTCALLQKLGVHRRGGVSKLAMGLPYVLTRDVDALERMTRFCGRFAWEDAEGKHCVEPQDVYLPAQGSGALIKHLGSNAKDKDRLVLVVDIGGQTTDCVATQNDRLVPACSRSVGVNVYRFFCDLVLCIEAEAYAIKRQWDYHDLMDRVKHGRWEVPGPDGTKQHIRACVNRTRARWTEMLHDAVSDTMGTRWPDIDRIVLTGGGAALVDTNVWSGPITLMDDMANVQGQHMALKGE